MRKAQPGFGIVLRVGTVCEVDMMAIPPHIEGSGQYCTYLACLVSFDIKNAEAEIYLMHDLQQECIRVPITSVVKSTMALPTEQFNLDEIVDVQYRVSDTDEYGWWMAIVKDYNVNTRMYQIEWYNNMGYEWVDKVHVRKAAFKIKAL